MKRSSSPNNGVLSRSTSPDIRPIKRKTTHLNRTTPKNNRSQKIENDIKAANLKNHDLCDACGDVGQFLCCDACPKSFHFTCVDPPMDFIDVENLKDKWYCNECDYKIKKKVKLPRSNPRGLFQKLIDYIPSQNPKSYQLPEHIIHFFEGVASDKTGKYIDTTLIKRPRTKHGEQPDYHQLKDKSGRFIICYFCRKTALKKPLIPCDYCNLHWHLDCLNPAMASIPNSTKRWRCPNHIENIIKPPRKQKNPIVIKEKIPYCAYKNYLNTIVDDNEIENNLIFKKNTRVQSSPVTPIEQLIPKQDGVVYRLPIKPFELDLNQLIKKTVHNKKHGVHNDRRNSIPSTLTSSSSSEVSTPPTTFTSPITLHKPISQIEDKNEIEDWLHTMASFQAGVSTLPNEKLLIQELSSKENESLDTKEQLIQLIQLVTEPSFVTCPSTPIPTFHKKRISAEKYQKYLKIESLLRQKTEQELLSILKP